MSRTKIAFTILEPLCPFIQLASCISGTMLAEWRADCRKAGVEVGRTDARKAATSDGGGSNEVLQQVKGQTRGARRREINRFHRLGKGEL